MPRVKHLVIFFMLTILMGCTLNDAVISGNFNRVERYILDGADINEVHATTGFTPLITAAYYGNLPMVKLLVEAGADKNIKCNKGYTAYDYAKKYEFNDIANYLNDTSTLYVNDLKWHGRSAEQVGAVTQKNFDFINEDDQGALQSDTDILKRLKKNADQGSAVAQNDLGLMYATGKGTPKNFIEAYVWLNLSSAQGLEIAEHNIAIIEPKMTQSQIAEAQKKAAELWKEMGKEDR